MWWLLDSGEYAATAGRVFAFLPASANLQVLNAGFLVYDLAFCAVTKLPLVALRHALSLCAWASTLVRRGRGSGRR